MTGQDLLNRMEDLNRELELQSGEVDVTRGIRALNTAQDHFESIASTIPNILGSTAGTVTTTASTETTAFPTGLLRVDDFWFVDPDTARPTYKLEPLDGTGAHVRDAPWPVRARHSTSSGRPTAYWTNGTTIYWDPLPDATHTVRWYGFQRVSDIAAADTFAYDDGVALPLAIFAVEILRRGLDDPIQDYIAMANQIFSSQITMMKRYQRQHAPARQYRYMHDT